MVSIVLLQNYLFIGTLQGRQLLKPRTIAATQERKFVFQPMFDAPEELDLSHTDFVSYPASGPLRDAYASHISGIEVVKAMPRLIT